MKKTILITSASSGIGRETAKRFQQKDSIIIATTSSPKNEPELNQLPNTQVARLDVQNRSSIAEAIDAG
ncbi:SDR family NAD(P)-dependent oxidoreductase [Mucilaginibacter sp. KACC 22773]|jgi:short-subunit dehydrogenase involved in D-alanine esterification of teichoic acids|uniref:SDR family NAD(P)-dependent oxidoreductase n=1 Tax=Mucilaginibacter sp. KACC 22773 TaxID=3025671 RepID=UPI002366DCA2|nr:SDR family NAD(P)-dependent oxidoreductase [Mucilaginibacter sp. KACC 22773]WDF80346.1 SDR family NAD(P)-dependent oxidoreductase [Mucilaginibacter sp. KACC 22773]